MFSECSGWGIVLHLLINYANTDLFNFFTTNFTAESPQIKSKQKGDFNKKEERSVSIFIKEYIRK